MCSLGLIWSFEKLVKIPISKLQPSTLPNFKLCEDTSITTKSHFSFTILLKISCSSKLSGVVLSLSPKFLSPIYVQIVPISPTLNPCFSNNDFIINVVVVFPLVPVTPINFNL